MIALLRLYITLSAFLLLQWVQLMAQADVYPEAFYSALEEAKIEQKLIVLNFYSEWCEPCQWMEKNTFKAEKVSDFLLKNTLRLSINIDDEMGFNLKEHLNINKLPTLLIYNKDGKMLRRIERTMNSAMLFKELYHLKGVPLEENIRHAVNISPGYSEQDISHFQSDTRLISEVDMQPKYYLQIAAMYNFKQISSLFLKVDTVFKNQFQIEFDHSGKKCLFKIISKPFHNKEEAESAEVLVRDKLGIDAYLIEK